MEVMIDSKLLENLVTYVSRYAESSLDVAYEMGDHPNAAGVEREGRDALRVVAEAQQVLGRDIATRDVADGVAHEQRMAASEINANSVREAMEHREALYGGGYARFDANVKDLERQDRDHGHGR